MPDQLLVPPFTPGVDFLEQLIDIEEDVHVDESLEHAKNPIACFD